MFKRISIFLIVLLTLLCFVGGASAVGLFVEKDAANTYIKYVDSSGTAIMVIDDTEGVSITDLTTDYTYTSMSITSSTDATSITTGSITTLGGVSIADQLWLGDDIDMTTNTTGIYDITLKNAQADALSIMAEGTDMMVFDTTTDAILIVPPLTLSAALISDSATDTTSGTSGAIQTDGGIGIAKNLWVAVNTRLVGTLTCDDVVSIDDTTESTGGTSGSLHTDGGVGIEKKLYVVGAVDFAATLQIDGAVTVSADGAGVDVKFYADASGHLVWLESTGDSDGQWHFGSDTHGIMVVMYSGTTSSGVFWDPNGDSLSGVLSVGATGGSKGVDVVFYGDTTGNSLKWDQSADKLILTSTAATVLTMTATLTGSSAENVMEIILTDSQTNSSGYSRGLYVNVTVDGDKTSMGEVNSVGIDLTPTGDAYIATPLSIYTGGCGDGVIDNLWGIYMYLDDIGGAATVATKYGISIGIDNGDNATLCGYLRFYEHSGSTMVDYVMDFPNSGHAAATYFFHVGLSGGFVQATAWSNDDVNSDEPDGFVQFLLGSTPAKIPFWYDD